MTPPRDPRSRPKPTAERLDLMLESSLESVSLAEKLLLQFSEEIGFSEKERDEISLAVREAVANAVLHGNRGDASKKVIVQAEIRNAGLVISVRDEGEGFDPGTLPDPLRAENLLQRSGRGVFLVKCCMDELTMRRRGARGMEVIMVKYPSKIVSREDSKMSMQAASRQVDQVTVLDLSGRITLGEGSSILRESLRDLVGRGQNKILLNLADVSYIDSSGIGELVSGYTTITGQGGQLKLLNLTKKVHDLLQITKLITVFEFFDDEVKAIQSFT